MRCPIRRASARLAQNQTGGNEQEDDNATSSQAVEEPQALAEVAHDEVMPAVSDDQVRMINYHRFFLFYMTSFERKKAMPP